MKYKVGEVANLLGLSTTAIHYYEKEGVIKTKKESNGHRYYEIEDLVKLMQCKESRNRGVTLKEIANALQDDSYNNRMFLGNHIRNKKILEEKIELYKHLVNDLELYIGQLSKMDSMIGKYETKSCVPTWFNGDPGGNFMHKNSVDNEILKEWVERLPFTKLGALFYFELEQKNKPTATLGLLIKESEAQYWGIPQGSKVIYIQKQICLHTVIVCKSFFVHPDYGLDEVIHYMKKRGMKLAGPAFGSILFHDNGDEDTNTYVDLWIPIED